MEQQRINQSVIKQECQALLNRAMLLTDQCDWKVLADCYTEDGTLYRPSDSTNAIVGKEAIYKAFCSRADKATSHIIANSIFDIVSETSVKATSRVWLLTGNKSEGSAVSSGSKLLAGSFVDDLVYQDGQWLIKFRKGSINLKLSKVI